MNAHKVMTLCISFNGMQFNSSPHHFFDEVPLTLAIYIIGIFSHLAYKQLHESDRKVFVGREWGV